MNKKQLIEQIAHEADLPVKHASNALDALLLTIKNELTTGGSVELVNFGNFTTRERAARIGRNPQNGEKVQIQAATIPIFKAGKALKAAVNQ